MDCSIHVLFPAFFPSLLKVLAGLDFHNRRSATGGYESYVLSGRSAFSKALLGARHASLHSRFQAHAVRLYIRAFVPSCLRAFAL
jgi:hypothetical protein